MIIGLVGLPGSGKSSVARLLGQHYGWDTDDTDSVIESRLRCPIREYFESCGEPAFRDVEARVLREQVERSGPLVLATGGGIVLRQENRELLRKRCLVFYLRSTPEELARRLRHDSKRPLLQGVDALRKLRELSAVRDPLYRQTAHYVVDANRPTIWGLVHWICMQLELGGHVAPPNRLGA
ncbi:shikimate kinase [Inhella proteolytica]|uniref:Shikimate kinase n=1 Tax=Inhella proteolytica TaxID=2795029 RepID=A0A931J328_9BURK|nr:shikimate kinase [Inhella proteolytica]MBH9576012.1 shikimate kinase [Inhella proteolytica]